MGDPKSHKGRALSLEISFLTIWLTGWNDVPVPTLAWIRDRPGVRKGTMAIFDKGGQETGNKGGG
jgi:hypothetical protein